MPELSGISTDEHDQESKRVTSKVISGRKLDFGQAAAYLGLESRTLEENWRRWKIPAYRIGERFIRFDITDLDQWLKDHREEP